MTRLKVTRYIHVLLFNDIPEIFCATFHFEMIQVPSRIRNYDSSFKQS